MADKKLPFAHRYVHTSPFWEGALSRRLFVQYCRDSGRFQHPPRPVSIYTGRCNTEWREVSGSGQIYAFTFLRTHGYWIVNVLLDGAEVNLLGKLLDVEEQRIQIGARVELTWEVLSHGFPYPAFRLSTSGSIDLN